MSSDEGDDLGPCNFCTEDPVAGFNDVLFCENHVDEGMSEAARVMALSQDITDPQRIAAITEKFTEMYREADAAVDAEEMKVGDTIYGKTDYDPGTN